jgi:hypothetical protein
MLENRLTTNWIVRILIPLTLILVSVLAVSSPASAAAVTILSRTPGLNGLNAAKGSNIIVQFSSSINDATVTQNTFNVDGSLSGKISGTYSTTGDTVTFDSAADFRPGETVRVTLTTGIQDNVGDTLAAPVTWQFTVVVAPDPCIYNISSYTLVSSDYSRSVALGDFNGDGYLDIAKANDISAANLIYLNNGDGTFAAGYTIGSGAYSTLAMAAGDFDGDGDLDIVELNNRTQAYIYLNNGSGGFATALTFGINPLHETNSVAVGDVDGDGDLDLMVGTWNNSSYLYFNDGSAGFGTSAALPFGTHTQAVALADLDNDGDLDAVSTKGQDQNQYHLNNGSGVFSAGVNFGPNDQWINSIATGDANGDGWLDIVTGNNGGQNVVYLNDGTGNFGAISNNFGTGTDSTFSVALADIEGDGDLDIVTGNGSEQSKIYCSDGDGTFETVSIDFGSVYGSTMSAAIGDLDSDGDLDIAAGNWNGNDYVCFNGTPEINLKQGVNGIADGGTYDFGSKVAGDSTDIIFMIENSGDAGLTLTTLLTITGTDASQFSIAAQPASYVAVSGSATFTVRFSPTDGGAKTAIVSIANNDVDENTYDLNLTGTGLAPEIEITGNSIAIVNGDTTPADDDNTAFGGALVPGGSVTHTFTITNAGNRDLSLTGDPVISITGGGASCFSVTLLPQTTIVPAVSTNFQVTFQPTTFGSQSAAISIVNNDGDENPFTFTVQGGGVTFSGSGTPADPYLIYDVDDWLSLMTVTDVWSANFKLMADIDLSGAALTPVGNNSVKFTGVFDGNYRVVSNASLVNTSGQYYGVFGNIGPGGQVVRLGIDSVTVSASRFVGGLAGYNYGTITDCYSSGTITISTGGQIGGGLVGYSYNGTISGCYSTCTVKGLSFSGGLAGFSQNGMITNCYATGAVNGTSAVGGFAGRTSNTIITNSYATGNVTGISNIGGFAGICTVPSTACYWNKETSGRSTSPSGAGRTTAEMTYPYDTSVNTTYVGWDFTNVWVNDSESKNGGYPYFWWQEFPEIEILGNGVSIPNNGEYDFGNCALNSDTDIIFTIENTGEANLTLTTPLTIEGYDTDQFSLQSQPVSPVAPSENTTFTVRFTPTSEGYKSAYITIPNSDVDENPFYFDLIGIGVYPLTVTGITAENKVYDGNTTAVLDIAGAELSGVFDGDVVTLNTASASGTFAAAGVGNDITVTVSGLSIEGADAERYALTQPTASADITPASLTFNSLSYPTIVQGTENTSLGGIICCGSLYPTGSVRITLNGVTQNARVSSSDGSFSSVFATAGLTASGSPYTISYNYSGDSNFNGIDPDTSQTVTVSGSSQMAVGGEVSPVNKTRLLASLLVALAVIVAECILVLKKRPGPG